MAGRRTQIVMLVAVLAGLTLGGWGLYEAGQSRGLREAQVGSPLPALLLQPAAPAEAAQVSPGSEAPRPSAPPVIVALPQGATTSSGSSTAQGDAGARPTLGASIAAALGAIMWPLVALAAVLVLRQRLPSLLESLAGRVTKVGFAGVSIELPVATSLAPAWAAADSLDLRTATAVQVNDSSGLMFFEQLAQVGTADYAEIDLGAGEEWLTSRLFILAIVFAQAKGIEGIVFVETSGVRERYVTWAEPERVRWALAKEYWWLEAAYARAYSTIAAAPGFRVVSGRGEVPVPLTQQLVASFLDGVQNAAPGQGEWVLLPGTPVYEQASWLDGAKVARLLGRERRPAVRSDELRWRSGAELHRALQSMRGRFVPVTGDDGRFECLIDRRALLEQAGRSG